MAYSILDLYSPLASTEVDTVLYISGFASVAKPDRSNELVEPLEFTNLPTFMNCPQLLVNHKYIRNQDGSDGAVGTVEKAVPAFVDSENPANPTEWVVRSMLDNGFVSSWPKSKCPSVTIGDRGLFVVAKVTHLPTIERIKRRELGGFSWLGYSYDETDITGLKRLKAIDLLEISVVNGPCMSQSTLAITDENHPLLSQEINFSNYDVYKLGFAKSAYKIDDVKRYTKSLKMPTTLSENDSSYFIDFSNSNLVDAEKSISVSTHDRSIIAAPKITMSNVSLVGKINSTVIKEPEMEISNSEAEVVQVDKQEPLKLFVVDIDSFSTRFPNAAILKQKSTAIGETPVEIYSLEVPFAEAVETVKEVKTEVVAEAAQVVETLEPVETVADSISQLDRIASAVEKLLASHEETLKQQELLRQDVAAMKSVQEVKDEVKQEFQKAIAANEKVAKENRDQRERIEKQMQMFNQSVPNQDVRQEKVQSAKSVESEAINVFDFFGQVKEKI